MSSNSTSREDGLTSFFEEDVSFVNQDTGLPEVSQLLCSRYVQKWSQKDLG